MSAMDWMHAMYVDRDWLTLLAAFIVCCIIVMGLIFALWVFGTRMDLVDEVCEGCGLPAEKCDSEGVPLCQACYDDLELIDTEEER